MRRSFLPIALLVPLLMTACGGGGGGGGGGASEQAASSSPCPSGAVTIHMKNIAFEPKETSVKVGQEVCWTNDEDIQHDVVDEAGGRFKSELFDKGKTFTWKADKAGTVNYVCTVHPAMKAELDIG